MTISEHITTFDRRPVFDVGPDDITTITDPASKALRIEAGPSRSAAELEAMLELLAAQSWAASGLRALVIGHWGEMMDLTPAFVIDWLVANRHRLPSLSALFLGDVTVEDWEISWINQCDVTELVTELALRNLQVRGGNGLLFPAVNSDRLERLVIETGGLPSEVVDGVIASTLPALGHLELWLGSGDYGADTTVDHLRPLLEEPPPALRHLGLRNAEITNEIATAIIGTPLFAQLDSLDLSMGTLADDGAEALMGGGALEQLRLLDLSDNFLSEELVERLSPHATVRAADQKDAQRYRDEVLYYTSVSE